MGVVGVSEERCEQEESDGVKGSFDFEGKTCGVWETRWRLCRWAQFFLVFFYAATEGSMQRGGGETEIVREEVGWRKRESCRFFSFSFSVVSLQLHAFRQDGSIDEDRSFSRCINVCLFFVLFFCCKGDAVIFGVEFRRCLSLCSGAKPLQVLYFFFLVLFCVGFQKVGWRES